MRVRTCRNFLETKEGEELSKEQTGQRQTWVNDAMATLKEAVEAGWGNLDHIRQDTDLTVLHDLPEFKTLGTDQEGDE